MADILYWLAQKYDPQSDISDDINEEKDRVEFMRTIVNLFAVKARIKLNPKKLYQADSEAVAEILKITSVLYKVSTCINSGFDFQGYRRGGSCCLYAACQGGQLEAT